MNIDIKRALFPGLLSLSGDITEEFLYECGDNIDTLNLAFEKFSKLEGFDRVHEAIHIEGSALNLRIQEVLQTYMNATFIPEEFASEEGKSPSAEDIERGLQHAYIESFKLSSQFRKVLWDGLRKGCRERGYNDWANTFDFVYRAECRDPECWAEIRKTQQALTEVIIPPPNTVLNYETAVMSEARLNRVINPDTIAYMTAYGPNLYRTLEACTILRKNARVREFSGGWLDSGFARIEVGHKLSAALSLTDIPEEVESPWDYWSVIIPGGMFKMTLDVEGHGLCLETEIERLWCKGSNIQTVLYRVRPDKILDPTPASVREEYGSYGTSVYAHAFDELYSEPKGMLQTLLLNMVRGICLVVTDKEHERKGYWGNHSTNTPIKRKKGSTVGLGDRYVIGKPISIDLRDELARIVSGKQRTGSGPKVQFLVRGHWRNQPYGPGREQKRRQWIQPFWKGDEETRILLRPYEIKEES